MGLVGSMPQPVAAYHCHSRPLPIRCDPMPTEYQAHCSSCGHKGPVSPWGYQALILEESRIIPLPHPYEARTLREHGYSFFMAGVEGRYARVDYRVCLDCGT
ncbi:MAG: hypothetical protein CVU63_07330, partial [Deltaproteobacteria bacterium HGW-Deltaproteobacteria-20]